ncbi:MAG: hypothetical protein B6247_21190, partial [Candidatus Parabeggiatoa sp. nov. 2]
TVIDVLTGPGLAGGGTSSTVVTLSTDFTGSTGTANSVARSDHTHTGSAAAGHTHTDSDVADNLTLSGGTIDNSVIGATAPAAGTFTNLTVGGATPLVLEGATADVNKTTLAVTNPTTAQTITLPNASGTVVLESTTGCTDNQLLKKSGGTWTCAAVNAGDLTGVTAGTGLTGGGTSGEVTINVDTTAIQNRVSANCALGESIRVINTDGTVICDADDVGTGTVIDVLTGPGLAGGGTSGTVVTLSADFSGSTGTANSVARSDHTHTGSAAASHTHTDSDVADNLTLSGSTIDNSVIGATTPAAGTFTNLTVGGATPLVLEGATADVNKTTLAVTNPTTAQTITLPNASGTVVLESTTACTDNKILKKSGGIWVCDNDTSVTFAGSGSATTAAHSDHGHSGVYADAAATTTALAGKADAAATTTALAGKADAATTTTALAGKADTTHNHDANYYTESEADHHNRLGWKSRYHPQS